MNVLHFDVLPCRRRIAEGFQNFETAKIDIQSSVWVLSEKALILFSLGSGGLVADADAESSGLGVPR